MKYLLIISSLLCSAVLYGQISPPGLGNANTASWAAFGLRQGLNVNSTKESMTYVGMGRISTPSDANPFHQPAIWVVNQEFYNQFRTHWQYSVALSYRRQYEYLEHEPYAAADPSIKQEFRLYGRFSYLLKKSRWKLVVTYRQELRSFFDASFHSWEEDIQLRSRFRIQGTLHLNNAKTHKLVLSSEALGSIHHTKDKLEWDQWGYQESRFCLYYSFAPKNTSLQYSLGYMNNLLGNDKYLQDVHYIALDIIWENPFGKIKPEKVKPVEYFE